MTRVLDFSGPKGNKRYQLLWASLMAGGDGKGERTKEVIRMEAKLQDVLEPLGMSSNGSGPALRDLIEPAIPVAIQQSEFDLLQGYTEKTAWTPHTSRDVVDLWDWLSASEKVD